MIEHRADLDGVFHSLADATRRDILRRVINRPLSISELAGPYKISFAAIAKHITVLEGARLVKKTKRGRQQFITAQKPAVDAAAQHLRQYEALWNARLNALEEILNE